VAKTFYSTTEIADLFKVNRVTVYRWVKKGKVCAYEIGKHIKIHASEVNKMFEDFGLSGDVLDDLCGQFENNCSGESRGSGAERPGVKKLVVAVDDDKAILACIEDMFEQTDLSKSCILKTFSDSVVAALSIGGMKPDLLLIDIIMSGLDGIELAVKVRSIFKDVKIVFITGYPGKDAAERVKEVGASDFLIKPISLDSLARVIKENLNL
jgi:excisionase family DNA binding protein